MREAVRPSPELQAEIYKAYDAQPNLALLFEFQFDHINNPADDAQPNDYRYLFKLAYDFSGDEPDYWQ